MVRCRGFTIAISRSQTSTMMPADRSKARTRSTSCTGSCPRSRSCARGLPTIRGTRVTRRSIRSRSSRSIARCRKTTSRTSSSPRPRACSSRRSSIKSASAASCPTRARSRRCRSGPIATEQELRCEGWLSDKDVDGSFTWRTGNAVELFQRRNFLLPTERLDPETRDAMQIDSRELDFRLALRVLRERVVDATGLVEDGTAQSGPLPILGRMLDPEAMRAARGHAEPLPNGAPDLISPATELAAKALGWTGPAEVRAFLTKHPQGLRVAIALPAAPPWHAAHMELSAEIDRGDIFYDETPPPFRRIAPHRPTLTLYTIDRGTKRALVRWPTTIGGWADQRMPDGSLVQRWKESEVGPRVWRDLYAGPTWLAPKSTPDRELVKNLWNGHWALKTEEFGPGPHAAYGMILLEHLQAIKQKDGTERLDDNGIGTHGSASVTSIVNGTSHGCHRLYNQLAVRLGDFLLRHRNHVVRGEQAEQYRRFVWHNDEMFKAKLDTRGFLYELTPPVPVDVQKGNILSKRKVPPALSAPALP